jgi:hypothetical protein
MFPVLQTICVASLPAPLALLLLLLHRRRT